MTNIGSKARPVTAIGDHLPESYFRETEKTFALAVAGAGGTREFFLSLGGVKICLQAAGDTLLPRITATLAHLEVRDEAAVDFTICCWDDKAAAAKLPLPTRWMFNQTIHSCLGILTNHRFRTFYIEWLRILSCVDIEANIAYCRYGDVERLLMYEISGPLRPLFNLICNRRGMQLVHASAVGTASGTVLFAGPPGAGKSTLAILCLLEGISYQADDFCVLTAEKQPRSLSLYNIAKLREDAFPRFPSLRPILAHFQEEDGERKAFFYVHEHFPGQVLKEAPVRALVLPHISGEASSRLERAAPMDAVRAVISWSVKEMPKSDSLGEKIMLQAVARLPAYRLHLGRNERETMALIRSLLS